MNQPRVFSRRFERSVLTVGYLSRKAEQNCSKTIESSIWLNSAKLDETINILSSDILLFTSRNTFIEMDLQWVKTLEYLTLRSNDCKRHFCNFYDGYYWKVRFVFRTSRKWFFSSISNREEMNTKVTTVESKVHSDRMMTLWSCVQFVTISYNHFESPYLCSRLKNTRSKNLLKIENCCPSSKPTYFYF